MINLYFHESSTNHGCEAIVRSTSLLLPDGKCLYSRDKEGDIAYGIDKLMPIYSDDEISLSRRDKLKAGLYHKLKNGSDKLFVSLSHRDFFKQINNGGICLSIGGDNYCYAGTDELDYYNQILHDKGMKTVLWGCSIEPSTVTDLMRKDFARYDLIVARESISYDVLKSINANTVYACDPAFSLDSVELPLPQNFILGRTVGINMSPLIQKKESVDGITFDNYLNMLEYILKHTDYNLALIPHVVQSGNDDRDALRELYIALSDKERVAIIEDCNCMELKGYISRCSLFIGARTHATIAAYSTGVPTLVVGYSTKAKGIAKDLFGDDNGYVLPVQDLKHPYQMVDAFDWLNEHKDEINKCLCRKMPEYKSTLESAVEEVVKLL